MKDILMISSGDKVQFEYESKDELYIELNDWPPAILFRDDVIELIGFLSQFADQALDEDI